MRLSTATNLISELSGIGRTRKTKSFTMQEMVDRSKGEIKSLSDAEKICRAVISSKEANVADFVVVDGVFQKRDYNDFRIRIQVPSGTIVFTDCLRDIVKEHFPYSLVRGDDSIMMHLEYMQKHEAKGMAHGYVGNTDPEIFWDKKNEELYIGAAYTRDSDYNELENPNLEKVGRIETDLWWYSFMDKELYLSYGGTMDEVEELEIGKCVLEFHHTWSITDFTDSLDVGTFAIAKKITS